MTDISRSQVSRLAGEIDERVNAFLDRPLEGDWPYLWIDATYVKVREAGRIVSIAAIIAVAVNTHGGPEILGMCVGPSEAEPFWTDVLRSLMRRGLRGVKLVISDAHEGLRPPPPKSSMRRGNATACTSCVTPWPTLVKACAPWWLRCCARFSPRTAGPNAANNGAWWLINCAETSFCTHKYLFSWYFIWNCIGHDDCHMTLINKHSQKVRDE